MKFDLKKAAKLAAKRETVRIEQISNYEWRHATDNEALAILKNKQEEIIKHINGL